MSEEALRALAPGTRLEWNRGDTWLPVVLERGNGMGRYIVRHERMGWRQAAEPRDLREPLASCPHCGRSAT